MNSQQIAEGNDLFRKTFIGGKVLLTRPVQQSEHLSEILSLVRSFTNFTSDNDPYGEHDFGSFQLNGTKYFFKIDYYDQQFEFGADPYSEPFKRVLTIMEASEY